MTTGVATLQEVQVRLDWPAQAESGRLRLIAQRVKAPGMGYEFRSLAWDCRLVRDKAGGWACHGQVREGSGAPSRLDVDLGNAGTVAVLQRGGAQLSMRRDARTPDLTTLDLASVPVVWADALLKRAWPAVAIDGRLRGRLAIEAPGGGALRVHGPLRLDASKLHTRDASIDGERLMLDTRLDYRSRGNDLRIALDGSALGDLLVGNTFLSIQGRPARFAMNAERNGSGPWRMDGIRWQDGSTLSVEGGLQVNGDGSLRDVDLRFDSVDSSSLRERYLSGWLALVGMTGLQMKGRLDGSLRRQGSGAFELVANAHALDLLEPAKKLALEGLNGDLRVSPGSAVNSELRWRRGQLYGMDFGSAALPMTSRNGEIALRGPASVPLFDGALRFDHLRLVPPREGVKTRIDFGVTVDQIDFGQFAKAVGLPAFRGTMSGVIPAAHYADDVLTMDGGLGMQVFDGDVRISQLSIERPFGPATTLVSDIDFTGMDLLRLTEVLGFGSITGRLDGRLHDLRLVDWTPVRFDAALQTRQVPGVRQRISQRAVQNISSVGDSSFTGSLQGQLIGLFKDFGYRRIGIRCRLVNDVCRMSGLGEGSTPRSDAQGFTIVEGAGIPRLTVVGYNRRVAWPVLVERMKAVAEGDVKPVFGKQEQ